MQRRGDEAGNMTDGGLGRSRKELDEPPLVLGRDRKHIDDRQTIAEGESADIRVTPNVSA